MRIKMTNDAKGSSDGRFVTSFFKDEEYEVGTTQMSQSLAECFLDGKNAKEMKTSGDPKPDVVNVPTPTIGG